MPDQWIDLRHYAPLPSGINVEAMRPLMEHAVNAMREPIRVRLVRTADPELVWPMDDMGRAA